jgi:toxin YoeB
VGRIHFDSDAWEDFLFWLSSDRKTARLITEIQQDPFNGIGKPEPLKGELSTYWSRRITDEHRLAIPSRRQRNQGSQGAISLLMCRKLLADLDEHQHARPAILAQPATARRINRSVIVSGPCSRSPNSEALAAKPSTDLSEPVGTLSGRRPGQFSGNGQPRLGASQKPVD